MTEETKTTASKTTPKKRVAKKRVAPKTKKPVGEVISKIVSTIIPPALDPRWLQRTSRRMVLAVAEQDGTGEEKHRKAVALVANKVDRALVWPATPAGLLAESLDGVALKLILGAIVKHAYEALSEEGKVA